MVAIFFVLIPHHPDGTSSIPGNILKCMREGIRSCRNAARIESPHYEALLSFFIHFIRSVCVIAATHEKKKKLSEAELEMLHPSLNYRFSGGKKSF